MNLVVFVFSTYILLEQRHVSVIIARKSKVKQYDMGCECGKKEVDAHAEEDCELSAKLEGATDSDKYNRIVGGCEAGHTPWYKLIVFTSKVAGLDFSKALPAEREPRELCVDTL